MLEKTIISENDLGSHNDLTQFMTHRNVCCPKHIHYSMEYVTVTSGTLNMTVSGKEYTLHSRDAILILPFETHSFFTARQSVCHVASFSPELSGKFYDNIKGCTPTARIQQLCDTTFRIVDENFCRFTHSNIDPVHAGAVIFALCSEFLDKCDFIPEKRRFDEKTLEALEYVSDHYMYGITLAQTAERLGIHPVTLSRLFSSNLGVSFTQHVNSLRANSAAKLLASGSSTVTEAGFAAGYGSIRSFNRSFKICFGTTPKKFAAECREKKPC